MIINLFIIIHRLCEIKLKDKYDHKINLKLSFNRNKKGQKLKKYFK